MDRPTTYRGCGWQPVPRYIIRDRDSVYGEIFKRRLRAMAFVIGHRAAIAMAERHTERLIGRSDGNVLTMCRLRRTTPALPPPFLYGLLQQRENTPFLNKDAPLPRAVQAIGRILPTPILGGLHHHYVRI